MIFFSFFSLFIIIFYRFLFFTLWGLQIGSSLVLSFWMFPFSGVTFGLLPIWWSFKPPFPTVGGQISVVTMTVMASHMRSALRLHDSSLLWGEGSFLHLNCEEMNLPPTTERKKCSFGSLI